MSVTDGEAVERENVRLRWIVKDLHWLARRYCDGRMSYVTTLFNQHTRDLVEMGVRLEVTADADGTIWARDGMGRNLDHLSDEEAALGRPLEDWQRVPADQDEHLRLRADLATAQVRLRELEAERAAARFQMEGRMTPMPYEFEDDDINDVYQVSGAAGGAGGRGMTEVGHCICCGSSAVDEDYTPACGNPKHRYCFICFGRAHNDIHDWHCIGAGWDAATDEPRPSDAEQEAPHP